MEPTSVRRFDGERRAGGDVVLFAPDGGVVLLGSYPTEAPDLGGRLLAPGSGRGGAFVARFSPRGKTVWVRPFPLARLTTLGLARDGGIVLAASAPPPGWHGQDVDLGRSSDIVVTRLGSDGAVLWSKRLGTGEEDAPRAVAVDGSGRITVAVVVTGSVELRTAAGEVTLQRRGLVQLDAEGAYLWARELPDVNVEAISAGPDGTLWMAGCRGNSDHVFGYDDRQRRIVLENVPRADGAAAFVATYGARGAPRWATAFGFGSQCGVALVPDAAGGAAVVAVSDRTVETARPGGVHVTSQAETTVRWLDSQGREQWRDCFAARSGEGYELAVAVGADSGLSVVGSFRRAWGNDDGGGPVFAVRYAPDGTMLRSTHYSRGSGLFPGGIAVNAEGRVVAAASHDGHLTLIHFR